MYAREVNRRRPESADPRRRGSALAATLIVFVAVTGMVIAATQLSSIEVSASRRTIDEVRATALAETGVEEAKATFESALDKMRLREPLDGIRAYFPNGATTYALADGEPLTANGVNVGEYTTTMTLVSNTDDEIVVRVSSTGYVPAAPANLDPGRKVDAWDSIDVTLRYSLGPANVFDYGYFLDNWGWLNGSEITLNGNARCNGQMDLGGHAPTVSGSPIYDEVSFDGTNATVGNRLADGALWSGWDIANADCARGMAADTDTHHDFENAVEMPNLSDLTEYEARAIDEGGSVSIAGVTLASGVVGDDTLEFQNLFLVGTALAPIELNGTIVVRGDVIISGYVTGQGSIYAGGNVYLPDSVRYVNAPVTERPASNSDADMQAWLAQNWNRDFLGLFARENVVVGDHTDSNWQSYVGNWLASSMNSSHEDSGLDQIPNTVAGRDGVLGTADDDWLELDGQFTTEYYSAEDDALGLIPDGLSIGDRIPGSGEDIDGDGQYDDSLTLADFAFDDPLDAAHWEGNMPAVGISAYSAIASMNANHLDGVFFSNHAFSWCVFGSDPAVINGSMIARNDSIVYGTPEMIVNHDARLLGGASGMAGGMLPTTVMPVEIVQWRRNEVDPHLAAVQP